MKRLTALKNACCGTALAAVLLAGSPLAAQTRSVNFPPAVSKPPPPAKAPPKTQASGEDVSLHGKEFGPIMRKTQDRSPPPPTNLTVMYKLEYGETLSYTHPDGRVETFEQWKSYPNDGLTLMTQSNIQLADGNNYQYATKKLASGGFDPGDIPLLFMAGDYDFVFTDAEVENLRRFITDGGTILFNAARGRDEFTMAAMREMKRVLPQKKFMRLPLDHPIFNSRHRIKQLLTMVNGVQAVRPPDVYSIDIGTRAAAILVPTGMGASWSNTAYHPQGKHLVGESASRLGVNIVAYVLGSTEYGRFLAQKFPQYDGHTARGEVFRFAEVAYNGSWDVNPAIQNSVLQGLKENTGVDVYYAPEAVTLDDPKLSNFPMVWMTGHYDFQLSEAEAKNLAKYLKQGGMLVASAAAGLKPFDKALRRELKKVLPDAELIKLPPTHPIFVSGWNPVEKIVYTPAALREDPSLEYPEFYGLFLDGRLAVVYTPLDLMSGLNRESNAYAKGVTPDDSMRLVVNLITYALSH